MKMIFHWYCLLALLAISLVFFTKTGVFENPWLIGFLVTVLSFFGITIFLTNCVKRMQSEMIERRTLGAAENVTDCNQSDPPHEPPFIADFVIYKHKIDKTQPSRVIKARKEAIRRIKLHFGDPMQVTITGKLEKIDVKSDLYKVLPTVELRIDLSLNDAILSAAHLPPNEGHITEEITSDFLCRPWQLCLTKAGDPTYHDHIQFEGGEPYIQSVREWQKRLIELV